MHHIKSGESRTQKINHNITWILNKYEARKNRKYWYKSWEPNKLGVIYKGYDLIKLLLIYWPYDILFLDL